MNQTEIRLQALHRVAEKIVVSCINHERIPKEMIADLADECRAAEKHLNDKTR